MNSELEAYFVSARTAGVESREDPQVLQRKRVDLPARFLEQADSLLKPVMDSTAETLRRHGYGATVELVRDQSGSDPNTFPFITLHFSADRAWRPVNPVAPIHVEVIGDLVNGDGILFKFAVGIGRLR